MSLNSAGCTLKISIIIAQDAAQGKEDELLLVIEYLIGYSLIPGQSPRVCLFIDDLHLLLQFEPLGLD